MRGERRGQNQLNRRLKPNSHENRKHKWFSERATVRPFSTSSVSIEFGGAFNLQPLISPTHLSQQPLVIVFSLCCSLFSAKITLLQLTSLSLSFVSLSILSVAEISNSFFSPSSHVLSEGKWSMEYSRGSRSSERKGNLLLNLVLRENHSDFINFSSFPAFHFPIHVLLCFTSNLQGGKTAGEKKRTTAASPLI